MMPMDYKFDDRLWLDWPVITAFACSCALQPTSASDISEKWSALSSIIGIQCL
jgi:hypothetical protein